MTDNKERYRQLCETEGAQIPLFLQWWWWETVCLGKEWDVLLAEREGAIVGALPYMKGRRWGVRYSLMPQLTMYTGPWTSTPAGAATAVDDLLRQLDDLGLAAYVGRTMPGEDAAGRLAQHNYSVSHRHTYRFAPLRPLPELMAEASPLRRRDYRRLGEELTIDPAVAAAEFAELHTSHFAKAKGRDLIDRSLIERVCTEATRRGHGMVVGARQGDGRLAAAVFVPYDRQSAYLLMLARSADAPRNATAFVIWRAIDMLSGHTEAFDFEGSMEAGVEEYYRSFGPQQSPMVQYAKCRLPLIKKMLHL